MNSHTVLSSSTADLVKPPTSAQNTLDTVQKQAIYLMQSFQKLRCCSIGKMLPGVLIAYSIYISYMLWYNWLLLPLFALVPPATYKYISGLLFRYMFGYFPSFFNTLFTVHNLGETNVNLWYDMCCENWQDGNYIEVIKLLIETHTDVLAASVELDRLSYQKKTN